MTAVVLLNVGTPDSPAVKDVQKYLFEFLNDPRVINIPWLLRKILVNLIIVPFRAPKSAKLYQSLWTDKGSPLMFHSNSVKEKLSKELGENYSVHIAMRYGNPNIRDVMASIKTGGFSRIIIVPMFPHYASSSSGTAIEAALQQVKKWTVIPEVKVVGQFYDHPLFLEAFTERIKVYQPEQYDHVIFSYHGLPVSHITEVHPGNDCNNCTCDKHMPAHGRFCYRATCYETTRLLAARLGLKPGAFTQSFQSRLSKNWLTPFTDKVLMQKATEGAKSILIVAPAFVADCLETSVELGIEYKKLFIEAGGKQLQYVESLNDSPGWIKALKEIVMEGEDKK